MQPASQYFLDSALLKADIKESNTWLASEKDRIRSAQQRRSEHDKALEALGLDEVEAFAYALMLSREEGAKTGEHDMFAGDVFQEDTPQDLLLSTHVSDLTKPSVETVEGVTTPLLHESDIGIPMSSSDEPSASLKDDSFPVLSTSHTSQCSALDWGSILRPAVSLCTTQPEKLGTEKLLSTTKSGSLLISQDNAEEVDEDLLRALQLSLLDTQSQQGS